MTLPFERELKKKEALRIFYLYLFSNIFGYIILGINGLAVSNFVWPLVLIYRMSLK